MEKKKVSWLKRSLLIPAALLGALAFGGCKSTQLEEPSFLRQYSAPAAKAEPRVGGKKDASEPSETGKNYPLKFYISGKGTFAEDFARGSGSAKVVASPSENLRIPFYISGSYSESEQNKETLITKVLRGGAGIGGYADLSEDVRGYAEGALIGEGTNYDEEKDFDLDMTRCFGVGKVGIISKKLGIKALLSGGFGSGTYMGRIGTADLEDAARRGFISLKGKIRIAGKGDMTGFDAVDDESSENAQESEREKGFFALAGICYDEQEFKDLVIGRTPSAELGLEFRDEIHGLPYFVRLLATARNEEYRYPYAKDKKNEYYGVCADAGIKVGDCLTLTLGGGYDREQHGYGTVGATLSFGMKPKKKEK